MNSCTTGDSPFIQVTITPKELTSLESFYHNMMDIDKFWNIWCDVFFFGYFFCWNFNTIQFSFDCAAQWKNFCRSKFWLHIYRHSRTISSLTTNSELNDEHCSCLLASFSKARIRCLLPLARSMSVLLQFIR